MCHVRWRLSNQKREKQHEFLNKTLLKTIIQATL